ncbi:trypsin-like peptidase domain-containing protein [Rickettsiales bacterium LUAb2]
MRVISKVIFLVLLNIIIFSNISIADVKQVNEKLSFSNVIKKVSPSVVSIYASTSEVQNHNNLGNSEAYNHLFGKDSDDSYSIGSGVIISKSGLVITNAHVINNRNSIVVTLKDGREYKAKLIAINKNVDLGLLKIDDSEDFDYLNLYDETSSEVGDEVLAIGNPFGIGQTVTFGIISGFRNFENGSEVGFGKLIQIDAEINPGNSGGALIDSTGKLIGINSAVFTMNKAYVSKIGFAIPSSVIKLFVSRSLSGSSIKKYWIGLTGVTVDNTIAQQLNIKYPVGVLVAKIYKGGPAELAGIKQDDVIVKINDTDINAMSDLSFFIAKVDSEDPLKVIVLRNRKEVNLTLTPDIPKETPKKNMYVIDNGVLKGTALVNNSPAVSYEINSDSMVTGVVVYEFDSSSLLSKLGIRVGDFLIKIGTKDIKNTKDVSDYVANNPNNSYKLVFKRHDQVITLNINHNGF